MDRQEEVIGTCNLCGLPKYANHETHTALCVAFLELRTLVEKLEGELRKDGSAAIETKVRP